MAREQPGTLHRPMSILPTPTMGSPPILMARSTIMMVWCCDEDYGMDILEDLLVYYPTLSLFVIATHG